MQQLRQCLMLNPGECCRHCLTSAHQHFVQSLEDEKRRGSKALREARATAETDLVKVKQAVATAEQQRQEVTKQAECDAHRAAIKLTQANKSCKAAKQEASDAHKRVEVSDVAEHALWVLL